MKPMPLTILLQWGGELTALAMATAVILNTAECWGEN